MRWRLLQLLLKLFQNGERLRVVQTDPVALYNFDCCELRSELFQFKVQRQFELKDHTPLSQLDAAEWRQWQLGQVCVDPLKNQKVALQLCV